MLRCFRAPVALAFCALLSACESTEYSILIEARAQAGVQTLQVVTVPLGGGRTYTSDERPVNRDREQIDADPIRIAIKLDGPQDLLVHVRATTPARDLLVGSHCYNVRGVVRDTMLLVDLAQSADPDQDGFPRTPGDACKNGDGSPCTYSCPDAEVTDCSECTMADCSDGCMPSDDDCREANTETSAAIHPGATEFCEDSIDQDCDGMDVACDDQDDDGFVRCRSADQLGCDCDDFEPSWHPGAEDTCQDGADQNCDGDDSCDSDGDGFTASQPVGGVPDCDDTNPNIHPGAAEACDGVDNDCNHFVDEARECVGDDLDADGSDACAPGVTMGCDCNDCDPGVKPGNDEICGNHIDDDCDGTPDQPAACPSVDLDGDGQSMSGSDCDDTRNDVYSGAPDQCGDGIDQDCDGVDDSCASDTDGDGYSGESAECESDVNRHRGAAELCNGQDDDCDGTADEVLNASSGCAFDPRCTETPCTVDYATSFFHCGGCRVECSPLTADACMGRSCMCGPFAACLGNERCCSDACRDLQTDLSHCGACDAACNRVAADSCVGGQCQCGTAAPCGAGLTCCGGACVDVTNDTAHCGSCGVQCATPANGTGTCASSTCMIVCNSGFANCDANPANGCEVNLQNTPAHCGQCGNACPTPPHTSATCAGSTCGYQCNAGWADCNGSAGDGCEIDTQNNPAHCNGCGNACSAPGMSSPSCSGGVCGFNCNGGFHRCSGTCESNTSTATCGLSCSPCMPPANSSATCNGTSCGFTCSSGFHSCGGACASNNSTATCGSSCTPCSPPANATATCDGTSCDFNCNSGFHQCGGSCSSSNSVSSCGGACSPCMPPAHAVSTCNGSSCGFNCLPGFGDCDGDPDNGCEAPLDQDPNCGSCSTNCTGGEQCCPMGGIGECHNSC